MRSLNGEAEVIEALFIAAIVYAAFVIAVLVVAVRYDIPLLGAPAPKFPTLDEWKAIEAKIMALDIVSEPE